MAFPKLSVKVAKDPAQSFTLSEFLEHIASLWYTRSEKTQQDVVSWFTRVSKFQEVTQKSVYHTPRNHYIHTFSWPFRFFRRHWQWIT